MQSVTFVIMNLIIGALFWAIFGEGWAVDHAPEGLEVLLKAWVWPTRTDVLIMVGIGLGSAIGFIMLTAAYRNLEPSFAAPFEYCLLGYNLLWGLLLFRQVPDALTLVGIAIIVSPACSCSTARASAVSRWCSACSVHGGSDKPRRRLASTVALAYR